MYAWATVYSVVMMGDRCQGRPLDSTRWRNGLVVSVLDQRLQGRRFESAGCGLSRSNRGPVALCTLGLGLLNPPSSRGR